ncbi:YcaO-like family protein [Variovorax sp. 770b2]|uniref:YcaO-like family protein n=1 Tax=Variovorax sp. 770b2 TaxID=1566271 RepID=UPI0008EA430D|nr:YcaO-like family protein [Variovorax sp. 770b2]SFQ11362.1 thiazole/oxazole-forming peptide maturase, SagD family component [Variovorax sp. 770b2]
MPHLDITCNDALGGASFRLVEASIHWDDQNRSTGWGRDADLGTATWKAIGEAIERHCFVTLPEVVHARADELPGYLHADQLIRYLPEQVDSAVSGLAPFSPSQHRLWTLARPALGGEALHVLADFVCSPRAFAVGYRAQLVVHASTSGCASADALEVAVLRATLELIERDAFMRHWFSQSPGHRIDPRTLPQEARTRLDAMAQAGCEVGLQWLHMGTHPTWLAWAQHAERHFTCIGSATALSGIAALDAALNELETTALARASGVPLQAMAPQDVATPADHAALYATEQYFRRADAVLHATAAPLPFDEALAAFEASPHVLYTRLAQRGHTPYWVDLSAEEARDAIDGKTIYTVRAVAPGLIPMVFGHGRLPLGMDEWRRTGRFDLHPFT